MSRRLRVAQLSFWFVHAEEFCRRARTTRGVELVAAWDEDPTRGAARSQAYDVPFEPDLDRLLARPDIDAVSICTDPSRTPDLVEAAARAGKHVLAEKPMAASVADARRIVDAQRRYGVQIMPAYNLRHHPVARYVKSVVDEGRLGQVVRVRRLHGHYAEAEAASFQADAMAAGWADPVREHRDSLFFVGSHVALWYAWMFGLPTSVSAHRYQVMEGLPVEDNTTAVLNYQGKFTGVMEVSSTLIAQHAVSEIYGTDGVIVHRYGDLPATRVRHSSPDPVLLFDRATASWRVPRLPAHFLRHESASSSAALFLDALLHGRTVPDGPESVVTSTAILQAAELAAHDHREVQLAEVLAL